jgi:hypothetical protein
MDTPETRMHCLKMAMELGGKHEAVLSSAEQFLSFIVGPKPAVAMPERASDVPVKAAADEGASVEATPVDAIASCGTAMTMPEGGDLAEAVPVNEPAAAIIEANPVAETRAEDHVTATPSEDDAQVGAIVSEAVLPDPVEETSIAAVETHETSEITTHDDSSEVAASSGSPPVDVSAVAEETAETTVHAEPVTALAAGAEPVAETTIETVVAEPAVEPAADTTVAATQTPLDEAPEQPHHVHVAAHEEPAAVHH